MRVSASHQGRDPGIIYVATATADKSSYPSCLGDNVKGNLDFDLVNNLCDNLHHWVSSIGDRYSIADK